MVYLQTNYNSHGHMRYKVRDIFWSGDNMASVHSKDNFERSFWVLLLSILFFCVSFFFIRFYNTRI